MSDLYIIKQYMEHIMMENNKNIDEFFNEERKIYKENLEKLKITSYRGELNIVLFNNTFFNKKIHEKLMKMLNNFLGEKVIIYGFGTQIIQFTPIIEINKDSLKLIQKILDITNYDLSVTINIEILIKCIEQEEYYFVDFNELYQTNKIIYLLY